MSRERKMNIGAINHKNNKPMKDTKIEEVVIKIKETATRCKDEYGNITYELMEQDIIDLAESLTAIDSEEEKPIKPKFSAANILSWIQDGHAVPPYSQKDLLNYMISFVNHFTVLQQSEPSPVESSDVLPRDDFKLLEILTANCIKYDISFSGKETAVITKTAHEYASQRVERDVTRERIRET
jgi:hypothetical protein